MKKLISLLLLSLVLVGCAAQRPQPASTEPEPFAAVAAEALDSSPNWIQKDWESGAVHSYELSEPVHGLLPSENGLLLFSGADSTAIALLDTQTLQVSAIHEAGFLLMSENCTIQHLDGGLSYFHGPNMETVILDDNLREIRRIAAPEALTGIPLLSSDGKTLFYCTASAIRALDLDSGISRILKEASYPVQGLSGLLLGDAVLQVSITDTDGQQRMLFLSTETGQLLQEYTGIPILNASEDTWWGVLQEGSIQTFLFGHKDDIALSFCPRADFPDCYFLPDSFRVLTAIGDGSDSCLELYDLETGKRKSEAVVPGGLYPQYTTESADGCLWILCTQQHNGASVLCRWDPSASETADNAQYVDVYYTREEPDYDGIAACSIRARELSEKYGIEVLVYKDAVAMEPWDYHLEYEFQSDILRRELEALDARLNHFPEGFLQTLAEKFTALKICIVRSAEGSPESGSLDDVNGIQFMDGFDAYIVLAASHDTEYALYHELSHLIETVVLTESTAYDRWDKLNPTDFQYDNDYVLNQSRDGSPWLTEGREYFIDTYSMSYAKEDRARLLEYAMTADHAPLFASPNLQAKLRQMCIGIREAFGLEKSPETFLWEQYLTVPLAAGK